MAEWIEIPKRGLNFITSTSPLAMAEWIEIEMRYCGPMIMGLSPLAMAEWIEINVTGIHSPP